METHGTSFRDLERPQNRRHQEREWTAERACWCGMGLIVVTALIGLLGPGPLSSRERVSNDESLRVRFMGVERKEAPSLLEIWIQDRGSKSGDTVLVVSRTLADATTAQMIVPTPSGTAVESDKVLLTFRAGEGKEKGKIVYRYKHDRAGWISYEIGLAGHEPVRVSQLVLP
jgi:hypothetical protein